MPELFKRILSGSGAAYNTVYMEEKIKEIVSAFTKIPVGDIGPATPVDRQAVKSSILLHRMYARLAEEGLVVENYLAVKTFSDLLSNHGQKAVNTNGFPTTTVQAAAVPASGVFETPSGSIGIDIEELSSLPRTNDFRKEEFYTMNFTSSEIAYCVLQPDPYASFAGLFSAKEAIVKADGRQRSRSFHTIEITHGPEGEPLYPGFNLSISHAGGVAVAVAVPVRAEERPAGLQSLQPVRTGKGAVGISLLALALAILSIILGFIR